MIPDDPTLSQGGRLGPSITAPPAEKYTQSQIAEALMSVATSILHSQLDRSAALSLAGVLAVYINDPGNSGFKAGGTLEGSAAFNSLVAEKAPMLKLALSDPAAALAAARAEVAKHNASAGPLSTMAQAALGIGGAKGLGGRGSGDADRYGDVRAAGTDLSSAVVAEYTRQYSGMGFDQSTVNTFAAVHLGIGDFRMIEKMWGRDETVRAAQIANEFHFKGREAVGDVAGISEQERELYRRYRDAKTPEERQKIGDEIHRAAPRKGETPEEQRKRRDRIMKRVMDDMTARGADPRKASARVVDRDLDHHPRARRIVEQDMDKRDIKPREKLTDEEKIKKMKAVAAVTPARPEPTTTTAPQTKKLDLG